MVSKNSKIVENGVQKNQQSWNKYEDKIFFLIKQNVNSDIYGHILHIIANNTT